MPSEWPSRERGLPFITDQRIGIASGYVFAGNVGAERRREYTVMGDTVNLSARLMQAAGSGEILLDRDTAHRVEGAFVCDELAPVRVKGKREPVPVCRAVGPREETKLWAGRQASGKHRGTPIVGRERELAQVERIVEQVTAGHGQLLVVAGEAGTGKSRLIEELIALVYEKEKTMCVLGGNCLSYGSQSPYLPWVEFFATFFGLNADEGEQRADKVRRIEQRMAEADPALKNWVPLMAQLLGLPVPDNELTASLDAQLRKQRTFEITLTLLRHQARQVPLFLIVFEDVHWIDAISLELLNHVARNLADDRILLVVLHRPTIDLAKWTGYTHYNRIELADLPAEDALRLAQLKLGSEKLPSSLRECVLRGESRVNPFFVEEVIHSLIDRACLVPRQNGTGYDAVQDLSQVEIPDSVQALVMSRIDRLDESSKLTVKVAAVIGRTFRYRTLHGIYPVEITPERLRRNLERLSRLDLTPLDRPAPEWEYVFKHVTTQEVAYESLLYAHRRELHHRMGEYLEQMYADSLEEVYELLVHHYCHSGDQEKSWDYLVKAGNKARDRHANEAAIAHYTQALSLDGDRADAYRVYVSLGDVYRLIGQYEKASESYRNALGCHPPTVAKATGGRPATEGRPAAEVRRKIAKTWELQGQYEEALHYLHLTCAALDIGEPTPEIARIYGDMGWITMQQGDYDEALQLCRLGLNIAENLPQDEESPRVKAELQHTLGTIYLRTGDHDQAIAYFQTCIEMREGIRDLYGTIRSYNNLAHVYWSQSNYALAAEYVRKSLEMSRKIGHTHGTAMCYNNLGVIAYTLGEYPRAVEQYEKSLKIRREIGDVQGIADVFNNLGEVHHSLGNHPQALRYLQQAVKLLLEIGDKMTLMDAYRLLAEVELELNDEDKALEYCQLALELAQEIGNQEYEGIVRRVLGQIHRVAGRPREARRCLQESIAHLTVTGNRLELGRSTYELGITLKALGLQEGAAAGQAEAPSLPFMSEGRERLQQAIQIFEALGVEAELDKARAALDT